MAKYIGTYATSGDVQTALNNQELSRPFIAYTTDNEDVIFGPTADRAEVGDIVVYSVADDLLHYIKQADYSASTYPAADYVPVGVVAYPQTDDAIIGPSGEITFMGLNWLARTSPDNGQSIDAAIEWGYNGFDIPELTDYNNITGASTDFNGKANTQVVLQYATAQTDWRTASAITWTNADGYYPVFECAWRYHTSGTVQGDWYVPACGQLNYLQTNSDKLAKLNAGFTAIGVGLFELQGAYRGASTEGGASTAWFWNRTGWANNSHKAAPNYKARPFCSKLMTRI
jgi:hypothetical protein